jgi:hypothetical protein
VLLLVIACSTVAYRQDAPSSCALDIIIHAICFRARHQLDFYRCSFKQYSDSRASIALVNGNGLKSHVPGNGNMNAPSPPSILAAHITPINGNALPDFDPAIFAQLIEECLSYDEGGQPRWGTDVAVNHRLICVIVKAGIDPASIDPDDPFKAQGRNGDQVTRCLEVIDIAIRWSPLVLYALSGTDDLGPEVHMVPLFAWLVPKLLSVICQGQDEHDPASLKAWSVLSNLVASARTCSISYRDCETVADYIANCASGTNLASYCESMLTRQPRINYPASQVGLYRLSLRTNLFIGCLQFLHEQSGKAEAS